MKMQKYIYILATSFCFALVTAFFLPPAVFAFDRPAVSPGRTRPVFALTENQDIVVVTWRMGTNGPVFEATPLGESPESMALPRLPVVVGHLATCDEDVIACCFPAENQGGWKLAAWRVVDIQHSPDAAPIWARTVALSPESQPRLSIQDVDADGNPDLTLETRDAFYVASGPLDTNGELAESQSVAPPQESSAPSVTVERLDSEAPGGSTQFTLNLPDVTARAGSEIGVPLSATDAFNLLELRVTITFDPGILMPVQVIKAGLASDSVLLTQIDASRIDLALAANSPINGSGQLAIIYFRVNAQAAEGAISPLTLSDIDVSGPAFPPEASNGSVLVTKDDSLVILSLTPSEGKAGDRSLPIVVEGTGFDPGAIIDFGEGISVRSVDVVSSTEMHILIDIDDRATEGARDVQVQNPDGASAVAPEAFRVTRDAPHIPVLTSLSPSTLRVGVKNVPITIEGQNFPTDRRVRLRLSGTGVRIHHAVIKSETKIEALADVTWRAMAGARALEARFSRTRSVFTLGNALEVVVPPPPVITSISPLTVRQGQRSVPVIIKGQNFYGQVRLSASTRGVRFSSVRVNDAQTIEARISVALRAEEGPCSVTVEGVFLNLKSTADDALQIDSIPTPQIASVTPSEIAPGTTVSLQVQGQGFIETTRARFVGGGIRIVEQTFVRSTEIQMTVVVGRNARLGGRDLVVRNIPSRKTARKTDAIRIVDQP